MTSIRETKEPHRSPTGKLSMAEILEVFAATGQHPLKFTAYDGSTAGNEDAELGLDLRTPAVPPTWPPRPANSAWRAPTWRVTCRRTVCILVIRTNCSRR